MEHRNPNHRLPRSTSRMVANTHTPPRAHPLRNVTTINAGNEMSGYYGPQQYPQVYWQYPTAHYPGIPVAPILHHPQMAVVPVVPHLNMQPSQSIPRVMGPEDISPAKQEEKLMYRERQCNIEAALNIPLFPISPLNPDYPRHTANFGFTHYGSGHVHPSHFGGVYSTMYPTGQYFVPHYNDQSLASPHAHTPLQEENTRRYSQEGSPLTPSKRKASGSARRRAKAATSENKLVQSNKAGNSPNPARRLTTEPTVKSTLHIKSSLGSLQDPFVTHPNPHACEPQEQPRQAMTLCEVPRHNPIEYMANPHQGNSFQHSEGIVPNEPRTHQQPGMARAPMPVSLMNPVGFNTTQIPQAQGESGQYNPPESFTPWSAAPGGPINLATQGAPNRRVAHPERMIPQPVPGILNSELLAGIPRPDNSHRVASTLAWFHTDNRGEEHHRHQVDRIANEDRERRNRELAERGLPPVTNIRAEASNYLLGHLAVNLQSYLVGNRTEQARNFANWGPVPQQAIETNKGWTSSYFGNIGSPPSKDAENIQDDMEK
ncbi:hypothetical protein LOY89_001013 [Ophidiomyces ophidiicola]|uniref:Uncharacterized protein n=1 Tax=Ophidiomyces ophidiicola TaxID=1387563 RepID=A0ACB8V1T6_9EURO|nr:uncharacterized protein LOZ57_005437 [Ophidiomyces ophidiicola]KAI1924396.1 hypothetical protein LOZ64_000721 [Ophidiomyces ophidiicola]KAI1929297.1 hypothetical protein LOZ60_001766 [Ophidiomyces ophidiicola]KAI1942214.1 hypothetical protein LOZ57_005437 [Ophidiomyces ophidiicola]KAI1974963.1 hypothetical protein LOZ56_000991 [Ophidiomyces ophidiicola]KAI2015583.1 hypothetical protein LOZ49_000605 [Ophidiomyces ophidiicola]